jgi:hypothetical protein
MSEEKEKGSTTAAAGAVPIYTPFPSPAMGLPAEQIKEIRRRGQRYLFINVVLMFFVSIVVFVIGTFFFVVPRLAVSRLEVMHAESKVKELQEEVSILRQVLEQSATGEESAPIQAEPPPAKTTPNH